MIKVKIRKNVEHIFSIKFDRNKTKLKLILIFLNSATLNPIFLNPNITNEYLAVCGLSKLAPNIN
jgi:hypothetical protein